MASFLTNFLYNAKYVTLGHFAQPVVVPLDQEQVRIHNTIRMVLRKVERETRRMPRPGSTYWNDWWMSPEDCAREGREQEVNNWAMASDEPRDMQRRVFEQSMSHEELGGRVDYICTRNNRDDPEWDVFVRRAIEILGAEALGFDPQQPPESYTHRKAAQLLPGKVA